MAQLNFKVGQPLVCVNKAGWHDNSTGCNSLGPKFNEVVHFSRWFDCEYLVVKEYEFCTGDPEGDAYHGNYFEPLITDQDLEEQLKEVNQYIETI